MAATNWTGTYHCPDCPNKEGCSKDCPRRFSRELQDFMNKRRD